MRQPSQVLTSETGCHNFSVDTVRTHPPLPDLGTFQGRLEASGSLCRQGHTGSEPSGTPSLQDQCRGSGRRWGWPSFPWAVGLTPSRGLE